MDDEPKTQSFINSVTKLIVDVPVVYHAESRQYVVLWSDILNAFPGVANLTLRNGIASVPLAKHNFYHDINPKCIVYQPNVTLTVIHGGMVPPNSNSDRTDTTLIERTNFELNYAQSEIFSEVPSDRGPHGGRGIERVNFELNYAQSDIFSEVPSDRDPHGGRGRFLDLVVEGETESIQGIEEVTGGMERIEFRSSSEYEYHQSSSSVHNRIATAIPAATPPSSSNHINESGIDTTPPLSTTSSSESGTGSGVSISSATNIPPNNIDTADSGASLASGTTIIPDPTEIDPVEATSNWASIFRTLGDLQEQYHLTPEETTKMFTEITQST